MIARWTPDEADVLLDIDAAVAHCGRRPVATIRRHVDPVACDIRTRQLLFSASELTAKVVPLPRRTAHKRPNRHAA